MAKATERFKVITSSDVMVIESNKAALKVELQYGKDNQPTELVIAEMYWKDSTEWAYTKSQVRLSATKENANFLIKGIQDAFKASSKVEKSTSGEVKSFNVNDLSPNEANELLKVLLEKAKATNTVARKGGKK